MTTLLDSARPVRLHRQQKPRAPSGPTSGGLSTPTALAGRWPRLAQPLT